MQELPAIWEREDEKAMCSTDARNVRVQQHGEHKVAFPGAGLMELISPPTESGPIR